jgi:hypothetical protein
MYSEFGKDVEFVIVYIREAHPDRTVNGEKIPQPKTFEQRIGIAKTMCTKLEISIPTVIDGIDNKVGTQYAGMPDRLYLVTRDGKVAYKGARGPFGFHPAELTAAIRKELGIAEPKKKKAEKKATKKGKG